MYAANQTPSTADSDRCFFFRLPLELRIEIYQHVLHYDHGLTIDFDPHKDEVALRRGKDKSGTKGILPNPLILVCRQFESEARVLLEANSEIALYCTGFTTPSSYAFTRYLNYVSVTALQRLRKISVSGAKNAKPERLSWERASSYFESFAPFCLTNPNIRVIVRFESVGNIGKHSWFLTCLQVSEAIQILKSWRVTGVSHSPQLWMELILQRIGSTTASVLRDLPPNLRFSVLTEFPEHEVIQEINRPSTLLKLEHRDVELARWLWDEGI